MSERRRMTCLKCPRYDGESQRCREGKSNPRSKPDTVALAELFGLQILCHYNPFRDGLVLQTHFPTAEITRRATGRARPRSRRPGRVSVEIEETAE